MRLLLYILLLLCTLPSARAVSLPVVKLYGQFGDDYARGRMVLTDTTGDSAAYHVIARWRGQTTKQFYDKKSYAVKLIDADSASIDASLLGMRNDNSWILDAMPADVARMRNRVCFDLWNDFARDPYHQADEPKAVNGTRGHFVEVYLNDAYWGLYCLTEKVDRKQLKLKKKKSGSVRGVLYKSETAYGTTMWDPPLAADNSQETWMGWSSDYPDIEDDGDTNYGPLRDAVYFVLYASSDDFHNRAPQILDLPVWQDWFLLTNLALAVDNQGKNMFNFIYDCQQSEKLGITPWDMDVTWGRDWLRGQLPADSLRNGHHLWLRFTQDSLFFAQVKQRYAELRKTWFDKIALLERFDTYFDLFEQSGAAQRETQRWHRVNNVNLDFESERAYIHEWIPARLEALDVYLSNVVTSDPAIHAPGSDNGGDGKWYNLMGQPVDENRLSPGIYIHNRKKIVVK